MEISHLFDFYGLSLVIKSEIYMQSVFQASIVLFVCRNLIYILCN